MRASETNINKMAAIIGQLPIDGASTGIWLPAAIVAVLLP